MKKHYIFTLLFALCCIFIFQVGVCYAGIDSSNFTINSSGVFDETDITGGSILIDFGVMSGSCDGVSYTKASWYPNGFLPDNINTELGNPADGTFCVQIRRSTNHSIEYFYRPIYKAGGVWGNTPPSNIITITSPATGTTITDTSTDLVGAWANIDTDIYKNITLYFSSNFIGEQSVAKIITLTASSGNFTIPLSYFGISANGQWNLKGNATFKNTQLSDMYVSVDLISPVGYNLVFDVSGFHTPYTFTDFDTWYSANIVNYGSPSAWANGMIGYLQPILEKVAEFGARMQDYLNTDTAWQRGNDIGSIFPVVNAYIDKINIFFGGFPIAQFFQWGILIMIGMFAIKIILKLLSFIPVIGGGG